jgi:ring-1,2-phenylacetyl-CoA epoxidase subunit PaaC
MNATAESLRLNAGLDVQYVLRLADTALIHAQRLAEWSGHGPALEEDLALSNLALDLLGQSRSLLTFAARLHGQGLDEDRLAFFRDEREFYNLTLVEQPMRRSSGQSPGGDFADTVLRNCLLAAWFVPLWQGLAASREPDLAAIAGKAVKESRYHFQHAADWVVRLGDGTDESARRMQAAVKRIWPYVPEMFHPDAVDAHAATSGLGPARDTLRGAWLAAMQPVFVQAALPWPADLPSISTGTQGRHSEHMGYILAELQSLPRQHPEGRW